MNSSEAMILTVSDIVAMLMGDPSSPATGAVWQAASTIPALIHAESVLIIVLFPILLAAAQPLPPL